MKRSTLKKLAFTLVAMFIFTGAFAQMVAGDFSLISAQGSITYVTQGKAVPVYVTPDGTYHPTWTFPSNNITTGFTWVFTSASIPASITINQPSTLNYAEFTGVTVGGPYAVNVYELAPAAFGGCHDAGLDFNVYVTGRPTAAMTGSTVAAWIADAATATGSRQHICGDVAAGENLTVAFTETGVPAATLASYAYLVQARVINIDVTDAEIDADLVTAGTQPISLTSISDRVTTAKYKATTGSEVIATGGLTVLNSLRTKYTFTITKASNLPGATADGIVSNISQKSDYVSANGVPTLAQITTYPFTAGSTTVEYIVNPSPVTGPIYHITNTFAY